MMESPALYPPESPMMDLDEPAYPCKGCGEILEEGKAFELAGNRWHIECFRCNTCDTVLDSDSNLLLLGDGSLICNNCTYSCSACGNKIEDLAILTGDQAFCASCFRCRNCKRKIENLRYARTSQGIFCMSCHETLMARRRKKAKAAGQSSSSRGGVGGGGAGGAGSVGGQSPMLDKSLPPPPPPLPTTQSGFSSSHEEDTRSESFTDVPTELAPRPKRQNSSPLVDQKDILLQPNTYKPESSRGPSQASNFSSDTSATNTASDAAEPFSFIPLAFDPNQSPVKHPNVTSAKEEDRFSHARSADRNGSLGTGKSESSSVAGDSRPESARSGLLNSFPEKPRQSSMTTSNVDTRSRERERERERKDLTLSSSTTAATSPSPKTTSRSPMLQNAAFSSHPVNGFAERENRFALADAPKPKKIRSPAADHGFPEPPLQRPIRSDSLLKDNTNMLEEMVNNAKRDPDSRTESPRNTGSPDTPASSAASIDGDHTVQARPSSKKSDSSKMHRKSLLQLGEGFLGLSKDDTTKRSYEGRRSSKASPKPLESPRVPEAPASGSSTSTPVTATSLKGGFPSLSNSTAFTAPRPAPLPVSSSNTDIKNSSVTLSDQSTTDGHRSPSLPLHNQIGDLSMDEDLARIMGNESPSPQSLLRRVSNAAIKHGRSFSDLASRSSGSPKWKIPHGGGEYYGPDPGSPTSVLPPLKDDPLILKSALRRSDQKIAELEARLSGAEQVKQLDTNIRERRSHITTLDSQKEIAQRELEVLYKHTADAKNSGEAVNVENLQSLVLRDLGQKLEQLKSSYQPQIEELIQKKNQLLVDVESLNKQRDQARNEMERLNQKNRQLADLNNDIAQQIQARVESHREMFHPGAAAQQNGDANGLGIYDVRPQSGMTSSTELSGPTLHGEDGMVGAPHVINIRKGQAKKFNWKKGGQTVAKGIKGAFSSSRDGYDNSMYGPESYGPASARSAEQGFGFFGNRKGARTKLANGSIATTAVAEVVQTNPNGLFGIDLIVRADIERRQVPYIVTRCIEEVELRGMDMDGIYRKAGGTSQIRTIQEAFERGEDGEISNPEIDICAVTSVLKQYLRKLPTPLITFEIYEGMLQSATITDDDARVNHLRMLISSMPQIHRDTLEFLIFHLARVADREKENLMSSKNLAVVFAPTIMRDNNIQREMMDVHSKNDALTFLIAEGRKIFER